jgi:hypothetical protein
MLGLALWVGFFVIRISAPHIAAMAGRIPHFWNFRPAYCGDGGVDSLFFAFPPRILLAMRVGFLIFGISAPHIAAMAGRIPHFWNFRPAFYWQCGVDSSFFTFPPHIL